MNMQAADPSKLSSFWFSFSLIDQWSIIQAQPNFLSSPKIGNEQGEILQLKTGSKIPIGSTNMLIYTHFLYPTPQRKKKIKIPTNHLKD